MEKVRCDWVKMDPEMVLYHDTEWGSPCHDDRKLFEYLVLDAFQAGLSWRIVLHKRSGFERAFHAFDAAKVADMTPEDVERLLGDATIIRNRKKIEATISNARLVLEVAREFGSLDRYLWQFTGGATIVNRFVTESQIGTHSAESDAMSADLKKRGFKFLGTTVCYAFMQGAGLVNDHLVSCYRYTELVAPGSHSL